MILLFYDSYKPLLQFIQTLFFKPKPEIQDPFVQMSLLFYDSYKLSSSNQIYPKIQDPVSEMWLLFYDSHHSRYEQTSKLIQISQHQLVLALSQLFSPLSENFQPAQIALMASRPSSPSSPPATKRIAETLEKYLELHNIVEADKLKLKSNPRDAPLSATIKCNECLLTTMATSLKTDLLITVTNEKEIQALSYLCKRKESDSLHKTRWRGKVVIPAGDEYEYLKYKVKEYDVPMNPMNRPDEHGPSE